MKEETIKRVDTKGKEVELVRSEPLQMSLFQNFLDRSSDKYSHTIDLYDAIPKYCNSRKINAMRDENGRLSVLKRDFQCKSPKDGKVLAYNLTIVPAHIQCDDGEWRDFYPSEREELVEEALRKIAIDSISGVYLNNCAGVQFTLYQLRKELEKSGHGKNIKSLKESLDILNQSTMIVADSEGETKLKSALFPMLALSSRKEWKNDPKKTHCYVQFHPLMTESINCLSYRSVDYKILMNYSRSLSRWLHKLLFHNYVHAADGNSYNIKASTIVENSYRVNVKQLRQAVSAIDSALDDLQASGIISLYKKEPLYGATGRTMNDMKYSLYPSEYFIKEMRAANYRKRTLENIADKARFKGEA